MLFVGIVISVYAQETEYETKQNIHYYNEANTKSDDYIKERCVLDVYYPKSIKAFS